MGRQFADRKPKAIGIPVPSGPQSHQVMEAAVADVPAERVHDEPSVVMRAFDVHGHPVLPNSTSQTVPITEMPRGLGEVRVRLEPEPASVTDRAEHDPLGENQRHLHRFPRMTAEGISTNDGSFLLSHSFGPSAFFTPRHQASTRNSRTREKDACSEM